MNEVRISDVTMKKSGRSTDFSLSFKEKIELSKLLDRLGVSVIELPAIEHPKIDSLLIKSVASAVKGSAVAVTVGLSEESVEMTWNALREARAPRLQVCAPVSTVQMEYLYHKKPEAMLEAVRETVKACRARVSDVEFVAEDATRSDESFLVDTVNAAIEAGAATVTLSDTAGAMLPDEFDAFLRHISAAIPALADVSLGVSCSDELSMADSCAIAAIRCGAAELKASAYPVGVASVAHIARVLAAKGDKFGVKTVIHTTELRRLTGKIADLCSAARSKTSPFDSGVREEAEGMLLTCHDDRAAVLKAVERLGYDLSEEDGAKVYEAFQHIAGKKEGVSARELDAIVASAAMQVPPAYQLESYVVTSGNTISATAHLRLRRDGKLLEGVSIGDGPIDAAFLAIEQVTGRHYELDDFQIQAVTEGREAMGETVVRLRSEGKLFSGRGISTDIVGAGIAAYLSALNKIAYEEEEA